MKKERKSQIFTIIISVLISSAVNAFASGTLFDSNEVSYDNSHSGINATNVQGAVDDLYAAATDYSNINSRVTSLESFFKGTVTSYFTGHDLHIGAGETGNNYAYVDFFNNGINRAGVGTNSNGDLVIIAKDTNSAEGKGNINFKVNKFSINGTNIIDMMYPVGSIYISVSDNTQTKVETRFPGTKWTAFATGRTLVGVNSSDSDFNAVEKTAGKKAHQHRYGFQFSAWWSSVSLEGNPYSGLLNYSGTNNTVSLNAFSSATNTGSNTHIVNGASVGSTIEKGMSAYRREANTSVESNLMPYITVYMWKRTS